MKNVIIFTLFILSSCSSYIAGIEKQVAREEKSQKRFEDKGDDHFAGYRRMHPERDKRPIKNPVTYSLGSAGPSNQVKPPVKREYRPHRYKSADFVDKDSDGSLWTTPGTSSSIYTAQVERHTGDLIIINVLENLRNQISSELKRVFPEKKKKTAKKEGADKKSKDAPAPAPAANPEGEMDMKVYDKIAGTVAEEINRDYVLVKGRKQVIFKKEKRSIEVQALVSRKDLAENDNISSDRMLDTRVYVLRK